MTSTKSKQHGRLGPGAVTLALRKWRQGDSKLQTSHIATKWIREGASMITQQVKALTASQPEEERMDLQKVFSDLHTH